MIITVDDHVKKVIAYSLASGCVQRHQYSGTMLVFGTPN